MRSSTFELAELRRYGFAIGSDFQRARRANRAAFSGSPVRVDPFLAGTATESNAAARVTIEQQFSRNLTVTYSTNAATTNQYQLIQVEYAIRRDI